MTKVLVVDDDPIIVKLLTINLEGNGYEVISARNGEVEMLAELRRTSKIPVIIVSAYGSSEKVEQARELGIECFLNKPFDVGVLPEVLGVMFSPECTKEAWEG
jgi:two-component system KDP operon response regulator KdpE